MVTGARVFVSGVAPEALASCGHPGIGADAGVAALRAAGISEIEMTDRTAATMSLRCVVSQQDVANRALYRASPFGATISGQAINTDADMQKTM
ncbi:MAG TPA: hypothetical protein VND19_04060 [Acetobacteraceae bacterium]|nr:hypothetical protein [Acetobacteraceae bacterium]